MTKCTATLKYRGKLLTCTDYDDGWHFTHSCDGQHWGNETKKRNQCNYRNIYCGESIRCECDIDDNQPNHYAHTGTSKRYGNISWSQDKRPQPTVMFDGLCMGHRYGSHEADCLMLSAAIHQDAVNRLEHLREKSSCSISPECTGCPICRR